MPGKSKLTADAAEQAALRGFSKSEQRGEADRARAILLTLTLQLRLAPWLMIADVLSRLVQLWRAEMLGHPIDSAATSSRSDGRHLWP